MLKFYYHPSPNSAKVALFLEEAALPYELVPIDTRKGEQFSAAFRAINPNGKTPALVDGDAVVFDSNAILLYLAEKTGKFLPAKEPAARAALWSWLRLFDEISARPAAMRANALEDRHAFKTEVDAEARRNMFPQNLTNAA
jgi:glutathione S-transferase